jgi:hypothetical protein
MAERRSFSPVSAKKSGRQKGEKSHYDTAQSKSFLNIEILDMQKVVKIA